jgi:hypothetical protein
MQIRETQLELSASHQASLVVQQETSSTLTFRQVLGEVDRRESAAPDLQKEMRRLLYSLLDALLAAIEGEWGEEKTAACRPAAGEAEPTSAPAAQGARWQTVQVEQGCEKEATKVCAQGWVTTRDGERLAFDLHWQMQREFSWQGTRVAVRDVQLRDPLMLSFAGPACALSEQTIAFDLDGDGQPEPVPVPGANSAYLVFDRNANGRVDAGSELFGAATGQGFAELAQLDGDGNGWIDAGDAAFSKLGLWSGGEIASLASRQVGALYTHAVDAPFSLKTADNRLLGQIRAAGVYLSERGQAGVMQQVDLALPVTAAEQKPAQRQPLAKEQQGESAAIGGIGRQAEAL